MPGGDTLLSACLSLLERLDQARRESAPWPPPQLPELARQVWPHAADLAPAIQALASPHLPHGMLWQTLGLGLRGNPHHLRPRDRQGTRLAADLLALLKLHNRLLPQVLERAGLPPNGLPASELAGDGGWCDLCGQCCCHCGVVPAVPPEVDYPAWWHHALAGETLHPQPFCPFLFQALGAPAFYCSIHAIKPLPCRDFNQADCQRGRPGRGYRD